MRGRRLSAAIAAGCVLIGFAACKDDTVNQTSNATNNFTSVGPAGGFVTGPDGTRVDVPAGALSETVDMGIVEADAKEVPALPSTVVPIGRIYAFHPHGQVFSIDATITMPAPAGDIDIYRAEPGGWALFAKPKGKDGFVKFRSSTFSFYAAAAGTGGCVRDLDCFTGQKCSSSGTCVTGGDAGSDAVADSTPTDAGGDEDAAMDAGGAPDAADTAPVCTRTPSTPGKSGTVTSPTSWVPKTDGVAAVRSGNDAGTFFTEIRVELGDFTNMCGYALEKLEKANATTVYVQLSRTSTTSAPADFAPGVYTIESTVSSGVAQNIFVSAGKLSPTCAPGASPMSTGTVTITEVTTTNVKGSFDVTGTGTPYSGTFDVPICNTTVTGPSCCVP